MQPGSLCLKRLLHFSAAKEQRFPTVAQTENHHLLSKSWEQQLVKKESGKRGRNGGRELQKPPKLSFLQEHSLPHGQEAGESFLFLSYISKELISKINWNWDSGQFTNCSLPSLQFAPVSHSRLVYFLLASPCFAMVSASAPRLPPAAQLSEQRLYFMSLSQRQLWQQRHLHREAAWRGPGHRRGPGVPHPFLPRAGTGEADW